MLFARLFNALKLNKFTSASTFVNVSTLMSGTILSAFIPIIFSPVLSRIFSPGDYGITGLYTSVATLLGVVAYSHYSHAVMLAVEDKDAKQAVWFSICLTVFVGVLALIVIGILYSLSPTINSSSIGVWYFLIPLTVVLNGINTTLIMWGNRVQRYKTISYNRVCQAVFTAVTQLVFGLIVKGEAGLIVGLLTGQLVGVILLFERFLGPRRADNVGIPDFSGFKLIAVRHKNLFLYNTPSDFINSLINQAPYFLLQKFAGISAVGNYAFTQRFLGIPQLFISNAVTDVFKQRATSAYNAKGDCRKVFMKTFKTLSLIGLIPFLILIVFGPELITFIFGEQWREAGIFCQYLGFLYYLRFIVSPLSYVYFIAGRFKENFFLHLLFLISTISAFYIGNYFFRESYMLIFCYAISYSIIYIIYFVRSYKFCLK